MKLWQKTALLCAAALLCVAAACSALLLAYTRSALLDAARDGAAGRQQALAASFCELAGRYLRADDSEAVQAAVAGYCFSRFAGDSGVLLRGGRTLYSAVSADPLALLPLPEDALRPRLAEGRPAAGACSRPAAPSRCTARPTPSMWWRTSRACMRTSRAWRRRSCC